MESDVQEFLNHLTERYPPVKGIPSFSQGSEYDVLANIAKCTQQSDSMTANMDWFVKTLFEVQMNVQRNILQRNILIINETWMKEADKDLYEIPRYQHFYVYRKDKRGGGVSIFTKKDIDA